MLEAALLIMHGSMGDIFYSKVFPRLLMLLHCTPYWNALLRFDIQVAPVALRELSPFIFSLLCVAWVECNDKLLDDGDDYCDVYLHIFD